MSAIEIVKALGVTAELTGTELSALALRQMAADLADYPEADVLRALTRCRKELRHRLTLGDVIERVEQTDGRPGADEAWALALDAAREELTVVWTDEMAEAFGVARPIWAAGDKIGARMAFREAYERICRQRRECSRRPVWSASLGWHAGQRREALLRAEAQGLLPAAVVAGLLPAAPGGVVETLLLGGPGEVGPVSEQVRAWCQKLRQQLQRTVALRQAANEAAGRQAREDLAQRKRRAAVQVKAGGAA